MNASYDFNRHWITVPRNGPRSPAPVYKLVSYNILAQDQLLRHMTSYAGIDSQLLSWRRRLTNLRRELDTLNSDLLCLQEVQCNHLPQIVARLKNGVRHYDYVYQQKLEDRSDGCAILYDKHKFLLADNRALACHIGNSGDSTRGAHQSTTDPCREYYALMAKFKLRSQTPQAEPKPERELIVANAHMLQWEASKPDIRQAQVKHLLKGMADFCYDNGSKMRNPILLAGDFNFETESEAYAILTARTASFRHPLQMVSIYGHNNSTATTCTPTLGWTNADHMFFSRGNQRHELRICSYYKLPRMRICERIGELPNKYLGSDHYCLGATFTVE
ncbi:protein angel-like [Scaptodrosophila lebanonensis]|uniref:Protein angel-like n=1 Tax=Drosophila lebanonensis TaxID=7225 RepID=A0A6J2UE99_DROLE|nr:protein angel-like [Scaptodrosophila lebanonensis]